jgi:hypothetical protein
LGRTIWRRWSGYHRRSRVETMMHCVKRLGQPLSARDFDRQVTEFRVRVGVAGVEVAQSVLADTQSAILPLVPYLDTLRWVFIAVALGGIAAHDLGAPR